MNRYNGWKNRQTWNIALWIGNDEGLYRAAVDFMNTYKGRRPYYSFVKAYGLDSERTPDNIAYVSTRVNYAELNAMMRDLVA